jgi:hypothetical protein
MSSQPDAMEPPGGSMKRGGKEKVFEGPAGLSEFAAVAHALPSAKGAEPNPSADTHR